MKYGDVPRIAWLASDANPDLVTRSQYRELAARPFEPAEASTGAARPEPDPPTLPLETALMVRRLGGRNCPESAPATCGCSGLVYCRRLGRDASIRDCAACERIKAMN